MNQRLIAAVTCAALSLSAAGAAVALPDLLDTPAVIAEKAPEAALFDLTSTGSRLVAVGERGIVLTREGDAWVQSAVPVGVTLTAAAFNGGGIGLAVGHDGVILRSTDDGANWERIIDGRTLFPPLVAAAQARYDAAAVALEAATDDTREDLEFDLDDQLFRLETALASLEYGPAWPLLDVAFADAETAWAVGAYGLLLRSDDAGQGWEIVSDRVDNIDDLHLNAVMQTSGGDLVIAGEGGMLFHSSDDGETFNRWDTDDGLSLFGLEESGDLLVAYGFGNSFQTSTDGGASWQTEPLPDDFLLIGGFELGAGRIALVGGSGLLIEVTRDGVSAPVRPGGRRDFLSGGALMPDGTLILTGEAGLFSLKAEE